MGFAASRSETADTVSYDVTYDSGDQVSIAIEKTSDGSLRYTIGATVLAPTEAQGTWEQMVQRIDGELEL